MNDTSSSALGSLHLVRRWWTWVVAAVIVLALAGVFTSQRADLDGAQRTSIPIPSLVYGIEATSGGHTASILNLGIQNVGVPQVPTPVDVDGDLLPDVTVAVNLVDVQGVRNPPDLGKIIAPNIEINRFPLELGTTLLNRPSPPLRINVRFDVSDLEGQEDPMHVRFGYDTGAGGSIPGFFQATLKGLDDFYNPLQADISTKGDLITQSPDPLWYRGPLTVIGGFEQGTLKADLGLAYAPFPDKLGVTFAQDHSGAHIGYTHGFQGDVDLDANVALQDGNDRTTVDSRIERLPGQLGVDIDDDPDGGGIHFDSKSDGRLADVAVDFQGPLAHDVYKAHLNIEDLPSTMSATWSMPDDGSVKAKFDSSGQGIGAIEALITNKGGNPTGLPPFAFTEKQVLAVQQNADTDGLRVGGRLERIRSAQVTSTPDGVVDADVKVGDGELPLQVNGWLDLRHDDLPLIDANAVISPLPGDIGVHVAPGAGTEADPLKITYRTAESPDVDGSVKLQGPDATSATCGATDVTCADLRLRHVPSQVEARIFDLLHDGKREAHIDVDTQGVAKPDLFADVVLGPDASVNAGKPLVAHAEILGLTEIARIRTVEGKDDTLEKAEFHTCDYDYEADECRVGTEDRIGNLRFSIADFLPEDRPADLAPAYAATPNFATITARGRDHGNSVDFEATGRMQDIKEVTYVNDGAFGVRTNIGGGQPLAAVVDVDGIRFEDEGANTHFNDITGNVLISPLPETMAFCLNESGREVVDPTSNLTAPCQAANPFDPDGPALQKSPMSVAYDGSSPFDVTVDAELHDKGVEGSDDRDDHTVRGHLKVEHIPTKIRAHILDPKDVGGGPMLVTIDAPDSAGAGQINVDVGAQILDADLQCQDPRVPDSGDSATCASGRIEHLPTHVDLTYDPAVAHDNFVFDSAGPDPLDLKDLVVSSVSRDEETNRAKVLIADAQILGLPKRVAGTLSLPAPEVADGPVAVDLVATPPVDTIQATVRNFVAPDPIPDMPAQRAGLPDPDDFASFIQRGDAFKATVQVTDVKRVGFKNQVTADGKRLDTSVINVDFGKDHNIRGYVDLDTDGKEQLTGDVTLAQVPAGLQVCFRGPKTDATKDLVPADGTATYCDGNPVVDPDAPDGAPNPQTKQGAFELRMAPNTPASELDVDAFVRDARGGGADVIAARLSVDNIPNVIAGTFGDGKADVGGFKLDGTPDGIDRIAVHAASFDLPDDGWNAANRPYQPRFVDRAPFGDAAPSIQHVAVRADDSDFELRARLGATDGSPASTLHRVRLGDAPCKKPEPVDYGNGPLPDYGDRPDFPHFPTDDGTTYTCVRADFKPEGSSTVDPLDLSVIVDQGGQRLALHDAGLNDIPEFFQLNLAQADPNQDADPPIRPTCVGEGLSQPDNCVAPLARVDTPGNTDLFGVVEVGSLADVASLAQVVAREDLPDGNALPTSWSEHGVRARIGQFADRSAIKVGLDLPIPASFTFDQVGSWGKSSRATQATFYDASDLHFRYASRNPDGSGVANLGRLSALIHSFDDGSQVLLSDDTVTQGFEVPGELGLNMFTRDFSGKGRSFMQIDGRSSAQDLDMRVRLLGGDSEDDISRLDAQVRNVPPISPLTYDGSDEPSFRLRTEIMGDGKAPPDPSSTTPTGGEPPKEQECSPLLCVQTQVRLASVNAQFDFAPTPAQPARLLEAAIRTDGAKNGLEVRGFTDVHGGNGPGDGRFLAGAQLSVDPINIFLHAGIPFLGSLDFVMRSNLDAAVSLGGNFTGFNIGATDIDQMWNQLIFHGPNQPKLVGDGTTSFSLKQNLLHMKLTNGDGSASRLGPVDLNVDIMHGSAWALFVKLIGIDFLPPHSTLRIPMLNCSAGGILPAGLNSVQVDPNDDENVVAWPFFPFPLGNIHFSGVLAPLADLAGSLGGPFFCLVDTDQELMDGNGGKVHPADPLGADLVGSTVPDALSNPDLVPVDPPDQPHPTGVAPFTVPGNVAWCGTHSFSDLVIPAGRTVSVATTTSNLDIRGLTDVANDDFPPACPNTPDTPLGELQIVASGQVTVDGAISGDGASLVATNATGNAGGGHGADLPIFFADHGHGGRGGNSGVGGSPVPDDLTDPLGTTAGPPGSTVGGGGAAGAGGGIVRILTDTLVVNGSVRANGVSGTSAGDGSECSVADDPGTADVNEAVANHGHAGGGAGSGGGIVISAADIQNNGTISASGGAGGTGSAGGGGGGGGGEIKVITALRSGANPVVNGGGAGGSSCAADFPVPGDGGGDVGILRIDLGARSKVDLTTEPPEPEVDFWHSTADGQQLVLPYQSAAQASPGDDYRVTLCQTAINPDDIVSDDPNTDLATQLMGFSGGIQTPTLYGSEIFPGSGLYFPGQHCGVAVGAASPPVSGPSELNSVLVTNHQRFEGTISANPGGGELSRGYHGFYTVIWKSDVDGNDCFNPSDKSDPGQAGSTFDLLHCSAEEVPASPDAVLGIDNAKPNVRDITINGTAVTDHDGNVIPNSQPVLIAGRDVQVSWGDDDDLSKIVARQCTPDATTEQGLAACTPGQTITVGAGDGTKSIGIRVTDAAGNTDLFHADVLLDTTPPDSQGAIIPGSGTVGTNGWYTASPSYHLFGFDDHGGTGPGTPPYKYQFDEGDIRPCADPDLDCAIDGSAGHELPGIGRHTLRWAAFDLVGNHTSDADRDAHAISVKVDDEKPLSDILSVPAAPNGANGWFSGPTWVSFGAFDQPGASGFDPVVSDGETDTGGVFYSRNGVDLGEFDPLHPLRLQPGLNQVCWHSVDIAGNSEGERCKDFKVDEADPTATPATTGGTAGLAGWLTTSPNLTTTVADGGVLGSGVASDLAPSDQLCGQNPVIAPAAASGTCISIDDAPFLPINPASAVFALGEGRHEVRVFSTDRAGRRSAIATRLYKVDLSKPVAVGRTIAPQPSRGRWFRAEPTVVLRAADGDRQASGVSTIRYQVSVGTQATCAPAGSGFLTYTGPFVVPPGVHTVRYWSIDAAGRVGDCTTMPVSVDVTRPVPKALTAAPSIFVRVNVLGIIKLNPQTTQLKWTVQEDLSGTVGDKVHVDVVVYDLLGNPVRTLDAGEVTVLPGQTVSGQVAWDGRPDNLLGILPIGTYYYRVEATDAAGNPAMSGESHELLIARVL